MSTTAARLQATGEGAPAGGAGARLVVASDWEQVVSTAVEVLSGPTEDPFSLPLLVVPSRAHSLALSQQVALRHGVAVGMAGCTPSQLRHDLEGRLLGLPEHGDPWRADSLALRIAGVIESGPEPWLDAVHAHLTRLGESGVASPGWDLARQTATSLLRIAGRWPDMLAGWSRGRDTLPDGTALDPGHLWWAPLWRHLAQQDVGRTDPLERHRMLLDAVSTCAPPWRSCLWLAAASTSPTDRELAAALSARITTTVIHLDHSAASEEGPTARPWAAFDRVRPAGAAGWTRVLATRPCRAVDAEGRRASRDTLLDRLRDGVAGRPGRDCAPDGPAPDRTVVVHDCHGPDRQAEVIRDVLCDALADMTDLEPRDLLVICAPGSGLPGLLTGLTAAGDPGAGASQHPGRRIRVAATAPERPNPAAEAVLTVLRLGRARATSADLIDLCALPAVSRRFRFSSEDLMTIARLVEDSGIRWGVDAGSRASAGLPRVRQSTWLAGIERMLLGAAMASTPPGWLATVTPMEGIGSADIDLVGRLAELVSRIRRALLDTAEPTSLDQWSGRVSRIVEEITDSPDEPWAGPATVGCLSELATACPGAVVGRERIADILESRATSRTRPAWFSGAVQVCAPADLDGIGHAVVVLADPDTAPLPTGEFPGLNLADDPEQDPAALGRQLLLDALASARRRLVVVRQTLDPVTNAVMLPGPFSTTLDSALCDAGVCPADVTVRHGLQPFSPAEHPAGAAPAGPSWRSFDPVMMPDPVASVPEQVSRRTLLPPPHDLSTGIYSPADLAAILGHPARALLRTRLGTDTRSWRQEATGELPLELNALDGYGVRARLLADLESGASQAEALTAERLRGSTPPGELGLSPLRSQAERAAAVLSEAQRARGRSTPDLVRVDLELRGGAVAPLSFPDGALADPDRPLRLEDLVQVWDRAVVRTTASRASARDLLALWIELLAVSACATGPWHGVLASNSPARVLTAPGAERATELLAGLARLAWWSGQQLVPLPLRTAAVVAGLVRGPSSDWATGRSGVGVQWGRDHDADWAVFLDDSEQSWRDACIGLGTSAEDLSCWLLEPLMAASSGGSR
ncbi:exodeoxyribonuclease V subunit gamma [Acidipropionibacterium virtanenii]|uniref:RecBCD enzyme subunit RecC n=1 Tax=Acidipropionibacterium virtanenii TaxID=2057246 RepID=A0A344UTP4_9ACTN|nr:exodeoxyribonuclease V subunit gamma [Acidipropionibacterium virtanenii]AXE38642.1 RecBCD enzyme subunit RecC [Acidipropionibacterium virtanenii]